MRLDIIPPFEALPMLLDRARSPVVALDTEFDANFPACRTSLHGVSLAGGTLETGYFGTFFPYGGAAGKEIVPWSWLKDRLLDPLFNDPLRSMVFHPPKVDLQIMRSRGVALDPKCKIECTMSMLHIYDENLPKGLKDATACLLGVHDTSSYKATHDKIRKLLKEGEKTVRSILKLCWETYRDERKKFTDAEVKFDPTWPSWKMMVMGQPAKLKKEELESRVHPLIVTAVMGDYQKRSQYEFEYYATRDALFTLGLRDFFMRNIPPENMPLLELETYTCFPVTAEMEERGLKIDIPLLRHIHAAMGASILALRADVLRLWGLSIEQLLQPGEEAEGDFNPGSSDQVAEVIWNKWQLRPPPWTMSHGELRRKFIRKTDGLCTVDGEVLEFLSKGKHPYVEHIQKLISLRSFEKLQSTFVSSLLAHAMADPLNRAHSSFWPVGARTGRYSSDDPNVENIPRPYTMPTVPMLPGIDPASPPPGITAEFEKDKKTVKLWRVCSLRRAFIADKGNKIISVDLSQIENRIMAHESQDSMLLYIYRHWDCKECGGSGETDQPLHKCPKCGAGDGKRDKTTPEQLPKKGFCLGFDIHSKTSVALGFDKKYGPEEGRQRGKPVNHAASYGMSAPTMARREDMSIKEAEEALDGWHATYPGVRPFHQRTKEEIVEFGFIRMFDGHVRRFFPQRTLMASNNFASWEWEGIIREAVNAKAQGGTGVIMKRAMRSIRKKLKTHQDPRYRASSAFINQVHDELLGEAPTEIAEDVKNIFVWELEHAAQLAVPVLADGHVASDWGSAKE